MGARSETDDSSRRDFLYEGVRGAFYATAALGLIGFARAVHERQFREGLLVHTGDQVHVFASGFGPNWQGTGLRKDVRGEGWCFECDRGMVELGKEDLLSVRLKKPDEKETREIEEAVTRFLARHEYQPPPLITPRRESKPRGENLRLASILGLDEVAPLMRMSAAQQIVSFWTQPDAGRGLRRLDISTPYGQIAPQRSNPEPDPAVIKPRQEMLAETFSSGHESRAVNGVRQPGRSRRHFLGLGGADNFVPALERA